LIGEAGLYPSALGLPSEGSAPANALEFLHELRLKFDVMLDETKLTPAQIIQGRFAMISELLAEWVNTEAYLRRSQRDGVVRQIARLAQELLEKPDLNPAEPLMRLALFINTCRG
jgi:hypothetical protein